MRRVGGAHPPLSVVARGNLGEEKEILTPVRVALLERIRENLGGARGLGDGTLVP